jgi:hypothetical protein
LALTRGDIPYLPCLEQTHYGDTSLLELIINGSYAQGVHTKANKLVPSFLDPTQEVTVDKNRADKARHTNETQLVPLVSDPSQMVTRMKNAREKSKFKKTTYKNEEITVHEAQKIKSSATRSFYGTPPSVLMPSSVLSFPQFGLSSRPLTACISTDWKSITPEVYTAINPPTDLRYFPFSDTLAPYKSFQNGLYTEYFLKRLQDGTIPSKGKGSKQNEATLMGPGYVRRIKKGLVAGELRRSGLRRDWDEEVDGVRSLSLFFCFDVVTLIFLSQICRSLRRSRTRRALAMRAARRSLRRSRMRRALARRAARGRLQRRRRTAPQRRTKTGPLARMRTRRH